MNKIVSVFSFVADSMSKAYNILYMILKFPDYDLEDIFSDEDIIRLSRVVDDMRRDKIKEIEFKSTDGLIYNITIL